MPKQVSRTKIFYEVSLFKHFVLRIRFLGNSSSGPGVISPFARTKIKRSIHHKRTRQKNNQRKSHNNAFITHLLPDISIAHKQYTKCMPTLKATLNTLPKSTKNARIAKYERKK